RPDKDNTLFFTALGKARIFRQKPVSGMDRVYIAALGHLNNSLNIEVSFQGAFIFPDQIRLIRFITVVRARILLGINGDRANPQLRTGTKDSDSNFSSVCDQHFVNLIQQSVTSFYGMDSPMKGRVPPE